MKEVLASILKSTPTPRNCICSSQETVGGKLVFISLLSWSTAPCVDDYCWVLT